MSTLELLDELCNKPKEEIQLAIIKLLIQNKLDFIDVSNAYTMYLETVKEDQLNKLIEAETCILESFLYKKVKSKDKDKSKGKSNWKHTQRCLYNLVQSKRFKLDDYKNDYNYDEELAKSFSWYERNKQ